MKMSIANMGRVLARIHEIEGKIYPSTQMPAEPQEPFVDVLEEVMATPYGDDGAMAPPVSASVAERLAHWEPSLQELCQKYDVDPDLARAVMRCESGGNAKAISRAGAVGLMQLMPATARGLGVDPKDPIRNLEGGIKYLSQLADKYDGDTVKVLAAYNAGSGRVDSYGGVPPFPETQNYVKNVLALYRRYSKGE